MNNIMNNAAQHTLDWYRCRLGYITGSNVGLLMKGGRGKTFSETAESYLYQLVSERTMNPNIINNDEMFQLYLAQTNITTKAMQWGNEQEENARLLYCAKTGISVVEVGSCRHSSIPFFASSPDGFHYNEDTGEKICLEIKCLGQKEYIKYLDLVHDGESLMKYNPQYFYQCHSHMMVTESSATDFVLYNPFQSKPMYIIRIEKDDAITDLISSKVALGNEFINDRVKKQKCLITV